jgi:hypothetical protein
MTNSRGVTLFIDPFSHHFLRDGLFNPHNPRLNRDNTLEPYVFLKQWFAEREIPVYTADRLLEGGVSSARNVYISLGIRDRYRKLAKRRDVVLSAFFALECPVVEPKIYLALTELQPFFKRLYSFSDSESLKPFLRGPLPLEKFHLPMPYEAANEELWQRGNRRFLIMINVNKLPRVYLNELYTERLRAIEYFSRIGELDLYGIGWDGPPYQTGTTWVPATLRRLQRALLRHWQRIHPDPLLEAARRVYRGPVTSKFDTLSQYIFCICFENMVLKGWITEKMFDCFYAGTIPIYRGEPEIEKHVPASCFIDMRRFRDYGELRSYLHSLTEKEIREYRENGREFLESPGFRPFTKHAYVEHFARIVSEDAGIRL